MKLRVLILGYGEMGHALEYLLGVHHDVHIWSRSTNSVLEDEIRQAQVILFCLPVSAHIEIIRRIEPYLAESSLCLSIAKGLDESGMTAAQAFASVLSDKHHFGVMYGPMISEEILLGRYAFADVALTCGDNFATVKGLFQDSTLICRQLTDMLGSSWSVILKNVYAIIFGVSDELKLGDNMRGHLIVTALAELSSIVTEFGGDATTPFTYAGLGDLLTTATSENSHHHELGRKLASGCFDNISGEGIHTLKIVDKFQIFDTQQYPLFTLIKDIVVAPDYLNAHLDKYLMKLRIG